MLGTLTRLVIAPFAPTSLRPKKAIRGRHSGLSSRPAPRQTEPAFRMYGLKVSAHLAW